MQTIDPAGKELKRQALWMREQAELALMEGDEEVPQVDIYKYVTANFWELVEAWKNAEDES